MFDLAIFISLLPCFYRERVYFERERERVAKLGERIHQQESKFISAQVVSLITRFVAIQLKNSIYGHILNHREKVVYPIWAHLTAGVQVTCIMSGLTSMIDRLSFNLGT